MKNIKFDMIKYFGTDTKRINHAIRVYGFATTISELENVSEKENEVIKIAAILHDIGIKEAEKKHHSTAGKYQEIEGPAIARQILEKRNVSNDIINRVCYLIANHHSYQNIDGIDFQILIEADFIVNIFEDQFKRKQIEHIRQKYFKTQTGINILDSMYPYK